MASGNPEQLIRNPNLSDLAKTEVVVPRTSRSVYDHVVRNIGVRMIVVDTLEELAKAQDPRSR